MRIDGNHESVQSYNTAQNPSNVQKSVEQTHKKEEVNKDIIEYIKQNPSYQPTTQEKLLIEAIETANEKMLGPQKEFEFAIHKETKQIMVKVIDKNTKEIIREIPPEKILDAVAHMCEMAGLFVDEKR